MTNDKDCCWGSEHGDRGLRLSKEASQSTAQLAFPKVDNENPFVLTAMPHETDCRQRAVGSGNKLKPAIEVSSVDDNKHESGSAT